MAAVQAIRPGDVLATHSLPAHQANQSCQPTESHSTTASIHYTVPTANGEDLFNRIGAEGSSASNDIRTNVRREPYQVQVRDLRSAQQDFNLRDNGFQLERLDVPANIDWTDASQVEQIYFPLASKLIKKATGASRVLVFDTTLRLGSAVNGEVSAPDPKIRGPVPFIHVDYTLASGPERVETLLPQDEADRLRKTPFAVIQVWRPIKPVDDSPLAIVDARTVAPEDLLPISIIFPHRTGQTYGVKHNPDHTFYYAKGMKVDEALVFVCYDSRKGRARFTPHCGFTDPQSCPNAPPRQSIELRAYAFWEHEPPQDIALEH